MKGLIKCIGCGRCINWYGHGLFAYTCLCGATIFKDKWGRLLIPHSFYYIAKHKPDRHIDYYIGITGYWNPDKQAIYEALRKMGATWSWECPRCREHTLKRIEIKLQLGEIRFNELHPQLQQILLKEVRWMPNEE